MRGVQSINFQACLIVAVFAAVSGEHWSLRKGSLQSAIVNEIATKGQPIRGRSPANCLEFVLQTLAQLGDTMQQ